MYTNPNNNKQYNKDKPDIAYNGCQAATHAVFVQDRVDRQYIASCM